MSVLLDTGVIFAYLNRQDVGHRKARELMVRIARKEFGAPSSRTMSLTSCSS